MFVIDFIEGFAFTLGFVAAAVLVLSVLGLGCLVGLCLVERRRRPGD